jgi:hypothetical protein
MESQDMREESNSIQIHELGKRAEIINYTHNPVDSFINLRDLTVRPNTSDPPLRDRQLDIFNTGGELLFTFIAIKCLL